MTPDFKIIAASIDITAKIRDRLLSLRLVDQTGLTADSLELTLDDRDHELELPKTGVELEVCLGYAEAGLTRMGKFTVDEVDLSGPPNKMIIRAQGFDSAKSLKVRKERSWNQISLGDLVATIAAEHELTDRVDSGLATTQIAHRDQTASDLHFLTRLARDHGAAVKVAGSYLVFATKGQAKSASGQDLPQIALTPTDVSTWRANITKRDAYKSVIAYWYDLAAAKRNQVIAGQGAPVKKLPRNQKSKSESLAIASAELARIKRGASTLNITLPGDPAWAAETKLILAGFRAGADGNWITNRVEHVLDNSGYSCAIEAGVAG